MTTTPFELSKRQFLISSAAAIAATTLPFATRQALAQAQWDLIVVGAGTTGLPAALFAAQRGARVLVIEKSHRIGGTLDRSGARMVAAGTKLQKQKGIDDSPDLHFEDIMQKSKGTVNQGLARLCVDNAADTINWLMDRNWDVDPSHPVITGSGHEPDSRPRYIWGDEAGLSVLKVLNPELAPYVASGQIRYLTRTDAVELIQNSNGAVTGVVAQDASGRKTDYRGRYVAITSGGCHANPKMFEEVHDVPLYGRRAYPFNQGGGITMGVAAGGYITGKEKYLSSFGQILTDFNFPSPASGFASVQPERRQPWEMFVNVHGQRFVREDHPSVDHREHALTEQPGHRYWIIFDQEIYDTAPPLIPSWSEEQVAMAFRRHHYFAKGETLGELAEWAAIDADGLMASVESYNRAQAAGNDKDYGREHMPLPIAKPPFYAVRMQGTTLLSWAGLAVDNQLRVIDQDDRAIPNLYAAGEVIGAGATCGNAVINGMMVTPAVTFGRLIGQRILNFA